VTERNDGNHLKDKTGDAAAAVAPPAGLAQLDALLQHRSRLGAMVLLAGADALNFTRLKALLDETDGNLGAQLRKLEDAGYLSVTKAFADRKPVSWYALTDAGRKALKTHLAAMETLVRSTNL
jgi:DNA-binding MarR family transcriptional regulator